MKFSRQAIAQSVGTMILCALVAAAAAAQAQPEAKQPMSEDVFKNVQVLRGITVSQFMETMGFISASLGLNCSDCHSIGTGLGGIRARQQYQADRAQDDADGGHARIAETLAESLW